MDEPLNMEFYNFEGEVWVAAQNGENFKLTEAHHDLVREITEKIEDFYPKAYEALRDMYSKSMPNVYYHRFLIARRFIRCNFGAIDDVKDIDRKGLFKLEYVPCPMRGECPFEGTVCRPEFSNRLSEAEKRVMKLWFEGKSKEDIAGELYLSVHTVNNHIKSAYFRLGTHTKAEFVKYAEAHGLFV